MSSTAENEGLMDRLDRVSKGAWYLYIVLVPVLLLSAYYLFVCTDRYVSTAKLIVEGENGPDVASLALGFLGTAGSEAGQDAELVKSYILSASLLDQLESKKQLRAHYGQSDIDWFSRLEDDASAEDFLEYFEKMVSVTIAEEVPIIVITVQAFDREYSQQLAAEIVKEAEEFVNNVGQSLAREQVGFVSGELEKANERIQAETKKLISLQNENSMLDPVLETQALAQIIGGLQYELSRARTELSAMESYLSPSASEIIGQKKKIAAIEHQVAAERAKQVKSGEISDPLNDLVLRFKESELAVQVALDVYKGSLASLEAAKLDASRKVKHLVRISGPTMPDESLMPRRLYNVGSLFVFLNLIFLVGGLAVASIRDHMD